MLLKEFKLPYKAGHKQLGVLCKTSVCLWSHRGEKRTSRRSVFSTPSNEAEGFMVSAVYPKAKMYVGLPITGFLCMQREREEVAVPSLLKPLRKKNVSANKVSGSRSGSHKKRIILQTEVLLMH